MWKIIYVILLLFPVQPNKMKTYFRRLPKFIKKTLCFTVLNLHNNLEASSEITNDDVITIKLL